MSINRVGLRLSLTTSSGDAGAIDERPLVMGLSGVAEPWIFRSRIAISFLQLAFDPILKILECKPGWCQVILI
jgi:hypothetical protein